MNESGEGALLGLPESETDLDVCEQKYQVNSVQWHSFVYEISIFPA